MSESDRPQRSFRPPAVIIVCARVIMGVLPIAQLVVGAMYQFDCPVQHYIPIYLMVMGVVSLLLTVLSIQPCCGSQTEAWSCLAALFLFCWFIAGNVWVYSIYEPNYNYCNKTVYLFAFWTNNVLYILLGVIIFSSCYTWLQGRDD